MRIVSLDGNTRSVALDERGLTAPEDSRCSAIDEVGGKIVRRVDVPGDISGISGSARLVSPHSAQVCVAVPAAMMACCFLICLRPTPRIRSQRSLPKKRKKLRTPATIITRSSHPPNAKLSAKPAQAM